MTIKAVFFDMGGTIETYGYTPELRLAATPGLRKILSKAGIHTGLSDEGLLHLVTYGLRKYHELALQTHEEFSSLKVWMEFVFPDQGFHEEDFQPIAEELMTYVETHFYEREMRPEVPLLLAQLKKAGLKIGLISNINSIHQVPDMLKKYGIYDFFNPIVLSSVYHIRKPDPAIFYHAARLAGVATGECAFVGDRIERDIKGATLAGFGLKIQVEHPFNHGEDDSGPDPDFCITSIRDVFPIIEKVNSVSLHEHCFPISAFLFDAGDVLYYRPRRFALFNAFLKNLGFDPKVNIGQAIRALKNQAFEGQIERSQYLREVVQLYGVRDQNQINEGMRILDLEDDQVVFFPEVSKTLHALKKRGFYLGIITDTAVPIAQKLKWFQEAGFGELFDCFISSKELGIQKPHLEIYWAAISQLGIAPSQAVFVGHDSEELDGAVAAGMRTVAFNHQEPVHADIFISKFSDLLQIEFTPLKKEV